MVTRLQRPAAGVVAADLRHRVAFQTRAQVGDGAPSDDYGNARAGDWSRMFTTSAAIVARFGGEEVQAARLAGRQPFTLTIRQDANARTVREDWRAVDVCTGSCQYAGRVFAIRSIADPDDARRFLDLLCETGVES